MASDDPYSRLYWRLATEYPEVWDDNDALATYSRLLVSADGAWPVAAATPVGIKPRAWRLLTSGRDPLVIPEADGRRYRIRGLDKHRQTRRDAARTAADAKWRNARRSADRSPTGDADRNARAETVVMHIPSRAETRRDEEKNQGSTSATRSDGRAHGLHAVDAQGDR